jgi:hypothetical protein
MAEQGFTVALCTKVKGDPRAYEHHSGNWRISTAVGRKWKLERWTGRTYHPPGHYFGNGLKVWCLVPRLFDTPLAVALWFHLVTIDGKIKEWNP